jgi:hypothetical protein
MIVVDRLLQRVGDTFFTNFATAPVLACVSAATVGALVAARRPRHPSGWLLLGLAISLTTSGLVAGIMQYGHLFGVMDTWGLHLAARSFPATADLALGFIGLILLLTPTGSPQHHAGGGG